MALIIYNKALEPCDGFSLAFCFFQIIFPGVNGAIADAFFPHSRWAKNQLILHLAKKADFYKSSFLFLGFMFAISILAREPNKEL